MKTLCWILFVAGFTASCKNPEGPDATSKVDSAMPRAVYDSAVLAGLDSAKWYYYCFYAVRDGNIVAPLEYYRVHPTVFNLEMIQHSVRTDTSLYLLSKTFKSSEFPCVKFQDTVEVAISSDATTLFYIKAFPRHKTLPRQGCYIPFVMTHAPYKGWKADKIILKQLKAFLDLHGTEVNPWFSAQAKAKGF